jgi:hypothetical protein
MNLKSHPLKLRVSPEEYFKTIIWCKYCGRIIIGDPRIHTKNVHEGGI